ncbi:MAG: glycosyltransferase family 4 protein [Candidatus Aenigmarchaeota archaeon]|nr:glycosyltransferase family 4 protein [Candidatus Aenigmarchaeota archaeon]
MKVLMLGWEYPPFVTGGLGVHSRGLTEGLARKNTDVTFIMPVGSDEMSTNPRIKVVRAGKRKKFIQIPSTMKPYLTSMDVKEETINGPKKKGDVYGDDMMKEAERFANLAAETARGEEFDLIHCHDWMTFPAGMKIKTESGKPLLVTVHSTEFDRMGSSSVSNGITHLEWKGMYEADRVITVSNYMKRRLVDLFSVPEEKIDVVYNAVDDVYRKGKANDHKKKERIVLFLGRLALQKGPDYFLHAARMVLEHEKNVKFVVVGKGGMLPQLINMSIQLGISDDVFFTGYQDDIGPYYEMADIYVMPSVSEPFGIAALEAMASGNPVLVSKQSGISEAIMHRLSFDFWDVEDLASKIIGILRHEPVRNLMAENGVRETKGFTWDKIAEKTLEVYSKLVN